MDFLITDSEILYKTAQHKFRFLLKGWLIENWNLKDSTEDFNLNLNGIEYTAADSMHEDLKKTIDQLKNKNLNHNKYLASRKNRTDIYFSLLYNSYWQLCINKHVLRLIIERLLNLVPTKINTISVELDYKYSLIETDFDRYFNEYLGEFRFQKDKKSTILKTIPKLKNIRYYLYNFYQNFVFLPNKKWTESETKIVLLIYDAPSLHIVLERFYQIIEEQNNLHLSIVSMSIGIEQKRAINAHKLTGKNISVYDYTQFRNANWTSHNDLYTELKKWHPNYSVIEYFQYIENQEVHYAWMANIFQKLKPNVCFTIGITESTRAISDVARYFSVPSINVDYGLFTDDSLFMQSNIQFDARACIGQANIDIWKKRFDPSIEHKLIGFCKLDSYQENTDDKQLFFEKHKLKVGAKTILFGGSWAASNKSYNIEKKKIIVELAGLCHQKNWNLLIKLHPAETDGIIQNCIAELNYPLQVVFEHQEESLNKLILLSDIVTTQSSSMVIDTLFFRKPFCYLSSLENGNITDLYSAFKEDKLVETYTSLEDFENFVDSFSNELNMNVWLENLKQKRNKYLYNPDGKASKRLLDLIIEFSKRK